MQDPFLSACFDYFLDDEENERDGNDEENERDDPDQESIARGGGGGRAEA
jgi:hypothetical protein